MMVILGIQHIRLTGGEPLMRQGVVNFIDALNRLKPHGLERISMTSNAFYLNKYARALKETGLDDLNISLDSIHADTFMNMTKRPIAPVLEGIAAAQQANLPIKLNCVLVAGQNDHEVLELTQWAYQQKIALRFIEYMPLDQPKHWQRQKVITEDNIVQILEPHFQIQKQARQHDPATIYLLNDQYTLGIISTISKPFCQSCDRLRIHQRESFLPVYLPTREHRYVIYFNKKIPLYYKPRFSMLCGIKKPGLLNINMPQHAKSVCMP